MDNIISDENFWHLCFPSRLAFLDLMLNAFFIWSKLKLKVSFYLMFSWWVPHDSITEEDGGRTQPFIKADKKFWHFCTPAQGHGSDSCSEPRILKMWSIVSTPVLKHTGYPKKVFVIRLHTVDLFFNWSMCTSKTFRNASLSAPDWVLCLSCMMRCGSVTDNTRYSSRNRTRLRTSVKIMAIESQRGGKFWCKVQGLPISSFHHV